MSRIKSKAEEIANQSPLEKWLGVLGNKSKTIQDQYKRNFDLFLELIEGTHESVIEDVKELEKNGEDYNKVISKLSEDFMNKRINGVIGFGDPPYNKVTANTAFMVNKAISSFLKSNGYSYIFTEKEAFVFVSEGKDVIKPEEIRKILDVCGSIRNKTIIMIAKDTGLRASDIVNMRVRHIRPIVEDNINFHKFRILIQKTKKKTAEKADPCLGTESANYLRYWWEERKELGLNGEDNDYIFCLVEGHKAFTDIKGRKVPKTKIGDPLDSGTITSFFNSLKKKAGITRNVSFHSLRKFNQTKLEVAGIPHNWILRLQGRSGTDSSKAYSIPDEELLEKYIEAYEHLSIFHETTRQQIQNMQNRLEHRIEQLENVNKALWRRLAQNGDQLWASKLISENGLDITENMRLGYTYRESVDKQIGPEQKDGKDEELEKLKKQMKQMIEQMGKLGVSIE